MSRFLLQQLDPNIQFKYLPAEELKKIVNLEIVLDFPEGAIDHHTLPGQWSCCKMIYTIFNNMNIFTDYLQITDYCHRADKGQLSRQERAQGSLIHTIYALRSNMVDGIDDEAIYKVFSHLVLKARVNPLYLTGYCEIEVSTVFPEYTSILLKETVGITNILRKFVRFVDISRHKFVALNNSNHNIATFLFSNYPVLAIVFKTPAGRGGIIIRKRCHNFNINEIYEELNKLEPDTWITENGNILTRTAKNNKVSTLKIEELLEILIKHFTE
ncbi:MAG: hypothetical protein QXP66_01755 [Candidatus Aenigmatarchaeota archaeon]